MLVSVMDDQEVNNLDEDETLCDADSAGSKNGKRHFHPWNAIPKADSPKDIF